MEEARENKVNAALRRSLSVKRTQTLEKRRPQHKAALSPVTATPRRPVLNGRWIVRPEIDEGPDAGLWEQFERIAAW